MFAEHDAVGLLAGSGFHDPFPTGHLESLLSSGFGISARLGSCLLHALYCTHLQNRMLRCLLCSVGEFMFLELCLYMFSFLA